VEIFGTLLNNGSKWQKSRIGLDESRQRLRVRTHSIRRRTGTGTKPTPWCVRNEDGVLVWLTTAKRKLSFRSAPTGN
jgi:hypothetical protein